MAITYMHPSISSTITDNSTTYVTADGTTKLFAVFTSEKGVDNVIKQISSVSEFEFNYGQPNIKKFGQVGYNIINWLNAGGIVYCLRVLPEDAGFANAIVNIQTKQGTKKVLNNVGELVEVPDVTIRPTITATNVNNVTLSAIEIDELRKPTKKTVDGYSNNMIFAVVPKGRGEGYNNLGFRISLLNTYDNTYEFRLYNFEVTKTSESGSVSTIQGPFVVSLDPDAVSISGESLFIKSVVDKYCDYFSIIFDEENYEKLGSIINPYVNPNRIDFFNGITKTIEGEKETYFDPITEKDEDIHMFITKYDSEGNSTGELNSVDTDDEIEAEIVNYDNTFRSNYHKRNQTTFENLKIALSKLKKVTESSNPIESHLVKELDYLENNTDLDASVSEMRTAFNDMVATANDTNYKALKSSLDSVKENINVTLDNVYTVFDFARINGSNDTSIALQTSLKDIESKMYSISNTNIKLTSQISELIDIESELANNKVTDLLVSEETVFVSDTIGKLYEIVKLLDALKVNYFTSDILNTVSTQYNSLVSCYNDMTAPYVTDEDYNVAINGNEEVDGAYDYIGKLTASLKTAINYTLAEVIYDVYDKVTAEMDNCKISAITLYDEMTTNAVAGNISETDVVTIIDTFKATVQESLQDTYNIKLQNFDNNIKLRFGSDGSISGKSYSSSEVERLIVRGYLGTVDTGLLDKYQYPIDVVLDANYSVNIKNAIVTLTTEIRDDFVAMLDTKCQANAEQAIAFRRGSLGFSNFRLSVWSQDFVVNDSAYTGLNMQVTAPYFLASKIPYNDTNYGIHWNFVGPRRGVISGFDSISYLPNPQWKEQLYEAQINYVEQDLNSTRFGSQLTSQSTVSALSNINNVRALLRIQREVEKLMADYQFEYNDNVTMSAAQSALGGYLAQWKSNRCCDSISGTVYASQYDKQQKLLRVKVEMTFNSIIERIAIDLVVNG